MELIDRDLLFGKDGLFAKRGCYGNCQYCGLWSKEGCRVILEAPAVDAVKVVHGRWIAVPSSDMMTGKAYKCSECNKMRYGSYHPNYCQCCGAKMDGDI